MPDACCSSPQTGAEVDMLEPAGGLCLPAETFHVKQEITAGG
jgi:hypothetical protein